MTDYSTQTVAQLKELLKSRGLSTEGKKADLVQRLTEADVPDAGAVSGAGDEAEPKADIVDATEKPAESTTETAEPAEKEEPKAEVKALSADDLKRLASELLEKKIARADKFGDEEAANAARKDLQRVSKFGVQPGTALAKEIGLVDTALGKGKKNRVHKRRWRK